MATSTLKAHRYPITSRIGARKLMNDRPHARTMLKQLSEAELDPLRGLADGESLRNLARRNSISELKAADLLNSMKGELGAASNAEAVRIFLTAAGSKD